MAEPNGDKERLLSEDPWRWTWSPDGEQLLVSKRSGEIEIVTVSSGNVRPLADGFDPQWSPLGDSVCFGRKNELDMTRLWLIELDGTKARQVSGTAARDTNLQASHQLCSWSPDGNFILYEEGSRGEINSLEKGSADHGDATETSEAEKADLWLAPISGGKEERLLEAVPTPQSIWTEGGKLITFGPGASSILWDPASGQGRILETPLAKELRIASMPNTERLLCWSEHSESLAVYISEESDRGWERVELPQGARWVQLSPDGSSLLVHHDNAPSDFFHRRYGPVRWDLVRLDGNPAASIRWDGETFQWEQSTVVDRSP